MKIIKNILTGAFAAGFSAIGTLFKVSPNQCTGLCKTCGGTCVQVFVFVPFIALMVFIAGKLRKFIRKII